MTDWYKIKRWLIRVNWVEKQFYPKLPFTPTSDTIAYYPLKTDLKDYSWNNRDLSMASWSFTFSDWVCLVNTSALTNEISIPYNRTAYTVSGWCMWNAASGWGFKILLEIYDRVNYRPRFFITPYNQVSGICSYDNTWISYVASKRFHIVCVIENNVSKFYCDWTYVWSQSTTSSATTAYARINSSGQYAASWWISELIIENKVRSADEITAYYNATKSKYGL